MLARGPVGILSTPRILGNIPFEIRSLPASGTRWSSSQGRQSLLRRGKSPNAQLEQIERRAEMGIDISLRGGYPRLLAFACQARSDHGHQDADDDNDQHQFDQSKPAVVL